MPPILRTVSATRYVTPLREGGSLPAIVEADDLGFYVLKFRGAGQGPLALVAELIAGEIGRALALEVPEVVRVDVDAALGRNEEDPEIRDLLKASVGVNLGLDYLPGSITFDAAARDAVEADLASSIVMATHPQWGQAPEVTRRFVRYGASPRGAQALVLGAKVRALADGRYNVSADDLKQLAAPALRHRVILNFEGEAEGIDVDTLIEQVVDSAVAATGQGKEQFVR